jgi:hypothetical protein
VGSDAERRWVPVLLPGRTAAAPRSGNGDGSRGARLGTLRSGGFHLVSDPEVSSESDVLSSCSTSWPKS